MRTLHGVVGKIMKKDTFGAAAASARMGRVGRPNHRLSSIVESYAKGACLKSEAGCIMKRTGFCACYGH